MQIRKKTVNKQAELEYLLKEYELQINWELSGLDRQEQIIQSFLTLLTATIGAIIVAIQSGGDLIFKISIILFGSIVLSVFSIFYIIRLCKYRIGFTKIRTSAFLIIQALNNYGIRTRTIRLQTEKLPSKGFSSTFTAFFTAFSVFCSLLFSIAAIFTTAISLSYLKKSVFEYDPFYLAIYGLPAFFGFLVCFFILRSIIRNYRKRDDQIFNLYINQEKKIKREI